jgi:hypothetical protein
MSKNLLILLTAVIYYTGCSKNGNNPVVPPTSTPGISIQSITTPAFVKSTWSNVLGGTASIEFDLLNANDSVTNKVSDNVDLNNLNGYFKSLNKGTYNVMASYQNNMVADTFLRFNALVNADNVTTKQNLTLPATSTDGLISISKTYIKDGTIPVFTPEAGGKTFKLGYINGYYYLYIQGGTTGSISFVSIATGQNVTKNLDIVTLNQYNMGVKVNNGVLQVTFVPFVKNSVAVNTATLLTLNINASAYSINKSVYFVVTDENGNVLNAVKYIPGTTTFKIASNQPFNEDRFNFFEINISALANTAPNILGFLQVKKGSIFTSNPSFPPQKPSKPVNLHFSNAPNFDQLNVSTEITGGYPITSLADTISIAQANGTYCWKTMGANAKK